MQSVVGAPAVVDQKTYLRYSAALPKYVLACKTIICEFLFPGTEQTETDRNTTTKGQRLSRHEH